MARLAAVKLSEIWGYQVVVDNRPGGSTIIGTEAVAKAAADGYTMLLASSALLTTPSLFPRLSYNVLTDFTGVATIGKSRHVLVLPMVCRPNTVRLEWLTCQSRRPQLLAQRLGWPSMA